MCVALGRRAALQPQDQKDKLGQSGVWLGRGHLKGASTPSVFDRVGIRAPSRAGAYSVLVASKSEVRGA